MNLVMSKARQERMTQALTQRYMVLFALLEARDLKSSREGAGRCAWADPDKMCAITGTEDQIHLAIADLQTLLKEITR